MFNKFLILATNLAVLTILNMALPAQASTLSELTTQGQAFISQLNTIMDKASDSIHYGAPKSYDEQFSIVSVAYTQAESLAQQVIPSLKQNIIDSVKNSEITPDQGQNLGTWLDWALDGKTFHLTQPDQTYMDTRIVGTLPLHNSGTREVEWPFSLKQFHLNFQFPVAPPPVVSPPIPPLGSAFTISELSQRSESFGTQLQAIREEVAGKVNTGSSNLSPGDSESLLIYAHARATDLADSIIPNLKRDILASVRGGTINSDDAQKLVARLNWFFEDRSFHYLEPQPRGSFRHGMAQVDWTFSMKKYNVSLCETGLSTL